VKQVGELDRILVTRPRADYPGSHRPRVPGALLILSLEQL
jgi:hypothetical protein